ncbi:hypothetical protein DFH06DRAFT_1463790 [Mycena polygramma]|nr:hypothetical protein DFH06DRAFT_1463790 [Mycena polygramma]
MYNSRMTRPRFLSSDMNPAGCSNERNLVAERVIDGEAQEDEVLPRQWPTRTRRRMERTPNPSPPSYLADLAVLPWTRRTPAFESVFEENVVTPVTTHSRDTTIGPSSITPPPSSRSSRRRRQGSEHRCFRQLALLGHYTARAHPGSARFALLSPTAIQHTHTPSMVCVRTQTARIRNHARIRTQSSRNLCSASCSRRGQTGVVSVISRCRLLLAHARSALIDPPAACPRPICVGVAHRTADCATSDIRHLPALVRGALDFGAGQAFSCIPSRRTSVPDALTLRLGVHGCASPAKLTRS